MNEKELRQDFFITDDGYINIRLKVTTEDKIEREENINIKWLSSKTIREKIYSYKSLPYWKAKNSKMSDLIKFILKDEKTVKYF